MLGSVVFPLLRLGFFTALVRGIFLWLEQSHQIYVDQWVAAMIGLAESAAVQVSAWVIWVVAGMVGLLITTIWEIAKYRSWFPWQAAPAGHRMQRLKELNTTLSRKERAQEIGTVYAEGVEIRNEAFSLRVLIHSLEGKMDELEPKLIEKVRDLAPERSINLKTINIYNEIDHPQCLLQEPGRQRAMIFSEVLRRTGKILEDYR